MKAQWLILLAFLPAGADAQRVKTCLSGDCNSGAGEAIIEDGVYYKGDFRKGRPDGEGYHANWAWAHKGSFKAGWKDGYGVEFASLKGSDGRYRADSSKPVTIGTWSGGVLTIGMQIAPDGSETYHTPNGFVNGARPADNWMRTQADAYQAVLRAKGVRAPAPQARPKDGYQCISGDCQNGTGTAIKYYNGKMDVYYSGRFEQGDLKEGTRVNYSWGYVGQLNWDKYDGYGARFNAKASGDDYVIDSAGPVTFAKWKENEEIESVYINQYGGRSYKRKGKTSDENIVKDARIIQDADAFYAMRKAHFQTAPVNTEEQLLLGTGKVNVGRNTWAKIIEWSCLPDRSYYVGVTNKTNHGYLPFGGVALLQISDESGKVVAEGEISRANPGIRWNSMPYWRPEKAGKYLFLVRFYQEEITGGHKEDYVDGVQLTWELHSYKK